MLNITLEYRKVALAKRRGGEEGMGGVEGWGQGWSAQDIQYTIFLLYAMTFNVRNVMEKVRYRPQSGVGIPASGSVRYRWSRTSPRYENMQFCEIYLFRKIAILRQP